MTAPEPRKRRERGEELLVCGAPTAARPRARAPRLRVGRLVAVVLSAALLGAALGGGAAAQAPQATVYTGLGFDTCDAPSLADLQAWLASPYRALGIYLGGVNRACPNAQLSAAWVSSAESLGWALLPLYVGDQAPCVQEQGVVRINAAQAETEGVAAAEDAVSSASTLGLPVGSPLYYDMEGYALDNAACTQAVQTFLSAWVSQLHAQGYLAGVYGSAASTMRDLQALATTSAAPDDVWIGDWDGDTSVFGDPYVSDALWTDHQRIHQFAGAHNESYAGVTINIDSDAVDAAALGPAAPAAGAPAPPTPAPNQTTTTTPASPSLSAAGSVTSADGAATVSWPAGAFSEPVVVSLTPSLPAQPVAGFGSGGYGVQLSVAQTQSNAAVESFSDPLTIHINPEQGPLAPLSSTNGTTWLPLPELVGGLLPAGIEAGYAREPDGSTVIETREGGEFALLPDTTPPPAPASLRGHFSHGTLVLAWPASSDAAGAAVSYQVSLTDMPLLTVSGQTVAALRAFHPRAPSVYRVRAIDAAGNLSAPSPPLVVLPTKRPAGVPDSVPAWAWSLFAWQQQGKVGSRPTTPRTLPEWFWRWRAWRSSPFHLKV